MPTTILIKGVYPYEIPDYNEEIHGEILFADKPKEDQYWVKTPHPKKFSSKKDEMDWVWREEKRLHYGLFFMNNGEMTYINGLHYEYLQYYDNGFDVDFWEEHRLYCYFLEFSKKLPTNWGDFTIKPRRAGVTQIHNVDTIRTARQYNKYCGLLSTDLEKVKSDIEQLQRSEPSNTAGGKKGKTFSVKKLNKIIRSLLKLNYQLKKTQNEQERKRN